MKTCPRSPSVLHARLRKWIGAASIPLMSLPWLLSTAAHAQNAIEAVTSTSRADVELVRIDFTQPLTALPTGFVVQEPARIALDFPGVTNAVGRAAIAFNLGNLRAANVVQAGERSRVVLSLKQATTYQAEIQGRSLLVTLQPGTGQPPRTSSTAEFAEGRERSTAPLKDIDFRRGGDGAGHVVIAMGSSQLGVDVRRQGTTLVADFMRASLPDALRRRLDVSDFGTAVESINAEQMGDRVRLTVASRGDWEQSAYQADEQFVIEVRPRKTDPGKLTPGTGYAGDKLTLNFQNVDVRALLQVIADFTGFNVVTSDSVSGALTLRLKDVPWDQALDVILQAKNLGLRKNGSVLWIAPRDEINAKEKIELEAQATLENLSALRTQSFQLNYAKAATVVQSLTGTGGGGGASSGTTTRLLSTRGSAIAEVRTNQLFVTDTQVRLADVAELIRKLDVPVRQVLIEARIVEASDTFGKSLGVKLGGGFTGKNSSFGTSPTGTDNAFTSYTNSNFVNLPAGDAGGTGNSAGTFSLSLFNSAFTRMLNLEISALEAEGKGRLVSSPRVITADQTKALIEQGEEIPYQQATSSGATSISFRKAVLKLEVTPQITPEGNIILTLDVSKDSRGTNTSAGPAINTKHVQTEVLVESGGTVVIGGIFELTETNDESRVPVLGEMPYLGALFRKRERVVTKVEMLVFITPKMVARQNAAL